MTGKKDEHAAYKAAKPIILALGLPVFSDAVNPLPLRVGSHDDLASLVGEELATDFLRCWTLRGEYRAVLVEGAGRYALDGTPDGTVTRDHLLRAAAVKTIPRTSRSIRERIKVARRKLRAAGITQKDAQRLHAKIARLEQEREDLYPAAAAQSRADRGLS